MNGVLIVDKPEGRTSFDVVAMVRRLLRVKKAGHTGTLDPMATGVLPVCLGDATRLVPFLTEGDKTYQARVRLGAATDTLDRTGRVVAESPWQGVARADVEAALERFRGPQRQAPPMYSAVRVDGKRLYELARQGVEVERATREVTVHALELLAFEPPELELRVHCSKGTYIRTLADDLGRALGTHAHLVALRRTASGGFDLSQALTLDELARMPLEEVEAALVRGPGALRVLEQVAIEPALAPRVRNGQRLSARDVPQLEGMVAGSKIALSAAGELIAVAEWRDGALRYLRVVPAGR